MVSKVFTVGPLFNPVMRVEMLWEQMKSRQRKSFVIFKKLERLTKEKEKGGLMLIKRNPAQTPSLTLSQSWRPVS